MVRHSHTENSLVVESSWLCYSSRFDGLFKFNSTVVKYYQSMLSAVAEDASLDKSNSYIKFDEIIGQKTRVFVSSLSQTSIPGSSCRPVSQPQQDMELLAP